MLRGSWPSALVTKRLCLSSCSPLWTCAIANLSATLAAFSKDVPAGIGILPQSGASLFPSLFMQFDGLRLACWVVPSVPRLHGRSYCSFDEGTDRF